MSFTLYPDQSDFVADINPALGKHKKIIACAATGFGKSKVAITICWAALAKGRTVLVVTESDKIYTQLNSEIPNTININSEAKLSYLHPNKLYLAMAQTLARRPELIKQFAEMGNNLLIINDEAHIGTATKLLLQLPDAYLIGLTATPAMKWAKHLPILYNGIVVGSQPEWLVENKRLTPYTHAQKIPEMGLTGLKVGNNGDYTEESQERIFDTPGAHRWLLEDLDAAAEAGQYRKCMIFCASIKSAESLAAYLTNDGYIVAVQHSKSDIRSEARQSYELGLFHDTNQPTGKSGCNICISIASMNKGYDFPIVDWIILWRATTSLPLYLQMCGRGSRIAPGKQQWKVTDWGGNGKRHGRWDYTHPWHDMWNKVKKKKEGIAPVKDCPKCDYLLPAMQMVCPNCGHEFHKQAKDEIAGVRTVMLEKQAQVIREFKGKRLSELDPIQLAQWGKAANKKNHAMRAAKAMEQWQTGYLETYGKAMGYKKGWALFHLPEHGEIVEFYDKII